MTNAVIVAHGQPSDPMPAEAALAEFAASVDRLTERAKVCSATLAAPNALETTLDRLTSETVIYPLFMAKGWFVTSALPKRLGHRDIRILDPLGVEPELPALAAVGLQKQLAERGWASEQTDLVVAAHGSGRSRNPSAVVADFVSKLTQHITFQNTSIGFVEERPSISDAASGTGSRALCLPFFACEGGHVLEDVPEELSKAEFAGDTLPVIGNFPAIKQHIATKLDLVFG